MLLLLFSTEIIKLPLSPRMQPCRVLHPTSQPRRTPLPAHKASNFMRQYR